jgi:hypothetical protein
MVLPFQNNDSGDGKKICKLEMANTGFITYNTALALFSNDFVLSVHGSLNPINKKSYS